MALKIRIALVLALILSTMLFLHLREDVVDMPPAEEVIEQESIKYIEDKIIEEEIDYGNNEVTQPKEDAEYEFINEEENNQEPLKKNDNKKEDEEIKLKDNFANSSTNNSIDKSRTVQKEESNLEKVLLFSAEEIPDFKITIDEFIKTHGKPLLTTEHGQDATEGKYITLEYEFGIVDFYFMEDDYYSVEFFIFEYFYPQLSIRGINVGDSVEEVLGKFPNSSDYETNWMKALYGCSEEGVRNRELNGTVFFNNKGDIEGIGFIDGLYSYQLKIKDNKVSTISIFIYIF